MLRIVKDNVKSLRKKSIPVEMPISEKDRKTLEEMVDYLVKSQDEEYCTKHKCLQSTTQKAKLNLLNMD